MQNDLTNFAVVKGIIVDPSRVSNVSPIIQINMEHPMFCFTVEFSDGSFQNICMPYTEQTMAETQNQMEKAHFAILAFLDSKN
jgi:hypothetical protein